ncbi:MAG: hypothetical protein [Caudoviricetes sp.]|nr:MAG: hypothetical protein [Caudoviricetes sp.]
MNLRSLIISRVRSEYKRTANLPFYQRYQKVKSVSKQKPHLAFISRMDIWYMGTAQAVLLDGTVNTLRGEIRNFPVLVNYGWGCFGMAERGVISATSGCKLLVIRGWR